MTTYTIIAAIGKNGELGKDNELIWHISEDMKFFKENTINKPVILGRKTLESLPHLLPNRLHLVLTHSNLEESDVLKTFSSIEELLDYCNKLDREVMVIGGRKIYEEFIDLADKLLLTEIDAESAADAYFPVFNKDDYTREVLSTFNDNNPPYEHILYKKKKS